MATHELYIGGPPTKNYSQAMFPAAPFDEAAKPFVDIGVAAHKGPIGFADTRLLDFGAVSGAGSVVGGRGDQALAEFMANNTVAQGDVLGVVLVPKNVLFLGFYYDVYGPKAGVTLTPKLRGKATVFTAIDCSTAARGFVAPGGGALVTEGAVTLADAQFDIKPDMLDLTLTALPADGLAGLGIIISPVLLAVDSGGYR